MEAPSRGGPGAGRLGALIRALHRSRCHATAPEILALARVLRRHGAAYSSTFATRPTAAASRPRSGRRRGGRPAFTCRSPTSSSRYRTTGAAPAACSRGDRRGPSSRVDPWTATRTRTTPPPIAAHSCPAGVEGGIAAMLERLAPREVRARIRAEIERDGLNNFGRIPSWTSCASPSRRTSSRGRPHTREIARRRGVDPLDGGATF